PTQSTLLPYTTLFRSPSVTEHLIESAAFEVAGFHFQPLEIMHGELPIFGFLVDDRFAYITDASEIPEKTLEKIKNVDVLVLNARSEEHTSELQSREKL